jgi:hypothetical protein
MLCVSKATFVLLILLILGFGSPLSNLIPGVQGWMSGDQQSN